jgi:Domain of unknown function (DUF4833)
MVALVVLVSGTTLASEPTATQAKRLFSIARSLNKNVVVYDAHLNAEGILDTRHPIDAYWILRASDGRREKLGYLERKMAYGFDVNCSSDTHCALTLSVFPSRVIDVTLVDGAMHAITRIANKRAKLTRIFVQLANDTLIPTVVYVELSGALENGTIVTERLQR